MDCMKIGRLIARLRKEKGLTQKNIADALGISNKAVSKWECGLGCPDLALWSELSLILGADMAQLMEGEMTPNSTDIGDIAKIRFYVCTICGNILVSTGSASIFCCGRKLEHIVPAAMLSACDICAEESDADYYVTIAHPMTKTHYIAFAAYVKNDRVFLTRLYPEQSPSFRFPMLTGGKLYIYCVQHGLMVYENIPQSKK